MRNLIAILLISICGYSSAANHVDDVQPGGQACLVNISGVNITRYVNVNYVRQVEVEKNNVKIGMASAYSHYAEFSIAYASNEQALVAVKQIVNNINNCKR